MTAVYVQSGHKSAGAANSSTFAYGSNVTGGNFKVAVVCKLIASSTLGCSDNLDGSWNQEISFTAQADTIAIFSKPNATAGATTVTFTGTGASGELIVDILEFSGVVTSTELDQTGSNSHGSSSAALAIATTGATTQAIELVIAASTLHASFPTSTWGAPYTFDPNGYSTPSQGGSLAVAYNVTASTGIQTGTVTPGASTSMVGAIATFFVVGGALPVVGAWVNAPLGPSLMAPFNPTQFRSFPFATTPAGGGFGITQIGRHINHSRHRRN